MMKSESNNIYKTKAINKNYKIGRKYRNRKKEWDSPIDIIYQRDSEHPYHLSAENLLVGSTCVRGSAFGDSFSLLCLIFALTENIHS